MGDESKSASEIEALRAEVRALQEQLSFTDHTSDQLSAEVVRAFEALRAMGARLDRIEARLGEVVSELESDALGGGAGGSMEGLELPPHSAGDRAQRMRDIEEAGG